jgi:type I restriction enzyme M protein
LADNQAKILEAFIKRENTAHFTALVDNSVIAENAYKLAVSSYVEQEYTRKVIDSHTLNAKITEIVKRQDVLRKAIDKIVNNLERGGNE